MAMKDQIAKVLGSLDEIQACQWCGTRLRFGDSECPHCGADIEEVLEAWAIRLLDSLGVRDRP